MRMSPGCRRPPFGRFTLWAALGAVASLALACSADEDLLRTELGPADPAPDFRLRDHFRRPGALVAGREAETPIVRMPVAPIQR